MYKNQLQEVAQRSCFNLPSYTCIREGPDHAPRFKATVNFNGETYDCPSYCTTLRQAEHSAAEVALNALSSRGPTNSLAARILDETGIYKNLLQDVSQRVGASLPTYTSFRSGLGHFPVFTCTVELAGIMFTGEPAKNKKQAEKNAAMAAWVALKLLAQQSENSLLQKVKNDEQEHVTVARALQKFLIRAKISNTPFPIRFPMPRPRPESLQPPSATTSKILPLISPKIARRSKHVGSAVNNSLMYSRMMPDGGPANVSRNDIFVSADSSLPSRHMFTTINDLFLPSAESPRFLPQKFPAAGAAPYIPVSHCRPHHGIAPPVTTRNAIPVYSAPPLPPHGQSAQVRRSPPMGVAPAVCIRQIVPAFSAPVGAEDSTAFKTIIPAPTRGEDFLPASKAPNTSPIRVEGLPTLNDPVRSAHVRVENPRSSKSLLATWPVQVENRPISRTSTISTVNAQDPQTCDTPVTSPPNSSMPLEELPESLVIKDLKELKV